MRVNTKARIDYFTVAQLTVRPPSSWANKNSSAHINLKISIDGEEKVNADTLLTSADVDAGISEIYTF